MAKKIKSNMVAAITLKVLPEEFFWLCGILGADVLQLDVKFGAYLIVLIIVTALQLFSKRSSAIVVLYFRISDHPRSHLGGNHCSSILSIDCFGV